MSRTGILILAVILAMPGTVFAQGLLDSILGQGGLGMWGPQPGQFDSPQYYGGSVGTAPAYPQGPEQPQYGGGYNPGAGYQQGQGYGNNQSGFYPDWYYSNPPAGTQAPPPGQYSAQPPVQYSAPPPVQYSVPQASAPPRQMGPPPQTGYPQGAAPPPLPPSGQYAADRGIEGSFDFDETLPSGAVRVTTSTPDGTTVQYYPPGGEPQMGPPPQQAPGPQNQRVQRPVRRLQAGQTRATATRGQTVGPRQASSIAMPKPVQIPTGEDPRAGWSGAVNRGSTGPVER